MAKEGGVCFDARVTGDLWRNVLTTSGWLSDSEGELVCLTYIHEWLFCVMLADVAMVGEHSLWDMQVEGIGNEMWDEVLTTYWQWLFRWELTQCRPPQSTTGLQVARGSGEEQRPVMVADLLCLERIKDEAAFNRLKKRYNAGGGEEGQPQVELE